MSGLSTHSGRHLECKRSLFVDITAGLIFASLVSYYVSHSSAGTTSLIPYIKLASTNYLVDLHCNKSINQPVCGSTSVLLLRFYSKLIYLSNRLRWALLGGFMLQLRERADMRTQSASVPTMTTLRATILFVTDAVNEDFGEPLYPLAELGNEIKEGHEEVEMEEHIF